MNVQPRGIHFIMITDHISFRRKLVDQAITSIATMYGVEVKINEGTSAYTFSSDIANVFQFLIKENEPFPFNELLLSSPLSLEELRKMKIRRSCFNPQPAAKEEKKIEPMQTQAISIIPQKRTFQIKFHYDETDMAQAKFLRSCNPKKGSNSQQSLVPLHLIRADSLSLSFWKGQ